ncbi:hypothetical protein [uncultured Thiodictyon sp.]|uniref:hypothetical protein n=1 Tax=uncultured Thiodictyon sp. TaxID=1846217 RepID=UPI0025D13A16|nr:hypothetical protein [uncultured Thiodictyon sp.]
MSYVELVSALKSADVFHKNLLLMFDDLVSLVREKAYNSILKDLTGPTGPEGGYWIWNANASEHRRLWIFSHDDRIRFVVMLIKTHEDHLKGNSAIFKAMCAQLKRDPRFPLLLIYGVFEPRDSNRFNKDQNLRRHWARNATLIEIRGEQEHSDIARLHLGDEFTLESQVDTDSWWCEKGKFVIRDLTTITDATELCCVADHLLNF